MGDGQRLALQAVLAHHIGSERDPVRRGEVDRLGAVEAGVESSVISVWEGDDERPRSMNQPDKRLRQGIG